ncbi:hypothetical protein DCS_05964 [Drechmeria coniospora]|uniref:Uncharacterized protein n=1 Tax=Drechmeria coniospora TaxID=98403 RepID=A0A151GAA1_DRECN|nr:hypothetical protein DCS_05964 [Drechmeria coniospora]KYK54014.1 hypothetical protein DCS_05964 [Drechmeria coniospora]
MSSALFPAQYFQRIISSVIFPAHHFQRIISSATFPAHHFQRTIPFTVRYLQRLFHLDARSVTFATHHLQPVLQPPTPPSSACSAIVISSKTRHGEFQGDTTVSACLFVCPGAAVPGDVVSRGRRHHDGESSAKERPNFDLQSMDTVDEVEDEVKDERGLAFTAR